MNRIPMTRVRLFCARILYFFLRIVFRKERYQIKRSGICYEINLSEGIDLSLFLFGHFQKHILQSKYFSISENAVMIDIGANIGSITLPMAKAASRGQIYAIEPSDYAFQKLERNIILNPELGKRIYVSKIFFSNTNAETSDLLAYSSWKIDRFKHIDAHPVHGGLIIATEKVAAITLDEFCESNSIEKVDFIKIDTDGHEYPVLLGAKKILQRDHPVIVFEVGLYLLQEQKVQFDDFLKLFDEIHYILIDPKNGGIINGDNYTKHIPRMATVDVIALFEGAGFNAEESCECHLHQHPAVSKPADIG
ncbi:MAG: FkbM family methyltransferase [Chlamydiota bacterium]|nr:FkbM family methyltransferase [Chlamydiota bacterium]